MGQSESADLAGGVDEDLRVFLGLAEGGESGVHTREADGSGDERCRVDRPVGQHMKRVAEFAGSPASATVSSEAISELGRQRSSARRKHAVRVANEAWETGACAMFS